MYLVNFETMDPVMLMSMVNMKLRDEFAGDLDELAKTYAISRHRLEEKLASAGFTFFPELGQFR
jgi:hypothetical protein